MKKKLLFTEFFLELRPYFLSDELVQILPLKTT